MDVVCSKAPDIEKAEAAGWSAAGPAYEHHSKLDWLEFSELLAASLLLLLLLLYKNSSPVLLLLLLKLLFRLFRFLIEQCVSIMMVMPQSLCTLF